MEKSNNLLHLSSWKWRIFDKFYLKYTNCDESIVKIN